MFYRIFTYTRKYIEDNLRIISVTLTIGYDTYILDEKIKNTILTKKWKCKSKTKYFRFLIFFCNISDLCGIIQNPDIHK